MDTPTHALIGRLTARRIWPEADANRTVNWITLMGVLPDIDTFFGGDDLTYIQEHRGVTHSFAGILAMGIAAAWLAGRLGVPGGYARRYAISVCGMLLHVMFDLVTSYGTQILYPFSDLRAAVDVLFIIDPYLTGILVVSLLAGWRLSKRAYAIGFACFLGYAGMNAALLGYGYAQVGSWAGEQGIAAERTGVMPMPFSPLHRRGFVESGDTTYWVTVPALGDAGGVVETYPRALTQDEIAFAWETEAGRAYRWFARFLVVTGREHGVTVVEDLTYKIRPHGLGWLGNAALAYMSAENDAFLDRRIFYLTVDKDEETVTFSR